MKTAADAVAMTAPAIATGCRTSASSRFTSGLLFQADHVGDERVDVGRRQLAVPVRHRRLLGGARLLRHLHRSDDPRFDLIGAQLLSDAVQGILLLALAGNGVAGLALLRRVDLFTLLHRVV